MPNKLVTPDMLRGGRTILDLIALYGENLLPDPPQIEQIQPGSKIVLSIEHLRLITPSCPDIKRINYLAALNQAMDSYGININFERTCFFLAQTMHECAELRYMEEIASGDAYDTRKDLGNTPQIDGDGRLYKGRGGLMATGHDAYLQFGQYVLRNPKLKSIYVNMYEQEDDPDTGGMFITHPQIVATLPWCMIVSGWVWEQFKKLNPVADNGDFRKCTKRINGGLTNHEDRKKYLTWTMNVLRPYRVLSVVDQSNYIL